MNMGYDTDYDYDVVKKDDGQRYMRVDTEKDGVQEILLHKKPEDSYSLSMFDKIGRFDSDSWESDFGLKTGFDSLDKVFNGFENGFYVIGGDSNLGKSGFISQLAHQVISKNPDTCVLDFSLDDNIKNKIPRVIASKYRVPMNAVKRPKMYRNTESYLSLMARRDRGLEKMKAWANAKKYMLYDSSEVNSIEDIEQEIQRFITQVSAGKPDRPHVVVFIDSYHDLTSKESCREYLMNKWDFLAKRCANIAQEYKIILIVTAELKKINGNRRPIVDDLKEAVKLKYKAEAIMLVYNEVHYKNENAGIYFERKDKATKQPVFEINVVKNKFNDWKGVIFFHYFPEYALYREASETVTKQYLNALYNIGVEA